MVPSLEFYSKRKFIFLKNQLFGRVNEHRRLNFRLSRGLVGFSSQTNGIRFLQSNTFHNLASVIATQPNVLPSLQEKNQLNHPYSVLRPKFHSIFGFIYNGKEGSQARKR